MTVVFGVSAQGVVNKEAALAEAYHDALATLTTSVLEEPYRRFKHRRLQRRVDAIDAVRWAVSCVRHDIEQKRVTQVKTKRVQK